MPFKKPSVKTDKYHNNAELDKLPLKLKESLNNIVKSEGFSKYKLSIKCISDLGLSFQADLFVVRIEGIVNEEPKELNLFIKYQITNSLMNICNIDVLYSNEIQAYTKLFVLFKEFEKAANVPIDERYNVVKYYDTNNSKAVIMENVSLKGYCVYNRWDIITLEYAEMALKELAKFHSISFVIKTMKHDAYENLIKNKKTANIFNESFENYYKSVFDNILDALECEDAKNKVSKFAETAFAKFMDVYNASKLQTNVLCHGDYRVNNILVKEENGVLSEVIILDFQCTYYGSPIHDIIFFLISATDRKFRKQHWNHLKNVYYDSLENFLVYFDIKANNVYPRQEFENDFERNLDYALIAAGHLLPIVLLPEGRTIEIHSTDDISSIQLTNSDEFKKRMREVVQDCIDWAVI